MINPGDKISHYIIVSALGSGGMGEVYLAKDTKLDRRVAIKFLHREFSKHSDALIRFVREAKAASSLNHPNIITIHEIGEWDEADYISMEFVEGHSLRELIRDRKLDLEKTVDILIQSASALAAAHEAGIVHRDIKPANIMRRKDNLVKVLDFGLAKRINSPRAGDGIDREATTDGLVVTGSGFVMGSPAYMSPEQARGLPTDARTDIWSLGVVLYEMISGQVPFPGETRSDMLAAILKSEPQPLSLPASGVSREIEHIIKKALGKDCDERYHVIKDLLLDLKILQGEIKSMETGAFPSPSPSKLQPQVSTREAGPYTTAGHDTGRRSFPFVIAAAALAVALAVGWYAWRKAGESEPIVFPSLASTQIISWKSDIGEGDSSRPRLSPDGKLVAYVASKSGKSAIWLKQIDGGAPFTRKQDDSIDTSPLWSPDGGQIAYFSDRGGRRGIWAAPALGGASSLLVSLDGRGNLIHWSKDGSTIFFKMGVDLYALNIAAKQISKLTAFDESQVFERDFSVSPDEKQIVYVDRQNARSDLWVSGLRGENPVRLTDDTHEDSSPVWHPDGKRIIYSSNRDGIRQISLVFVDGKRQSQLSLNDTDSSVADISQDGTKILYTTSKDDADLWGVSIESGKEFQLTSGTGVEFWPDISPNGERLAYQAIRHLSTGGKPFNSLVMEQRLNGEDRALQLAPDGFNPRWSPDGANIAFLRSRSGNHSLWITSADGVDLRAASEGGVMFGGYSILPYNRAQTHDYQWAPDGRSLVFSANRAGVSNIWQSFLDGSGEKQLTDNQDQKLLFFNPMFSPDGKRITWSAMTTEALDKRNWSIWIISHGMSTQLYQANSILRLVGWSASGDQVIVKSIESKIDTPLPADFTVFEIDVRDQRRRLLATLKASYFPNVGLSPDRKTLAFVTRFPSGDTIQTMTTSSPVTKPLLRGNDNRVYFSNLIFAPDGRTLYYGKQSNLQVISMINNFK